jgi:predicted ester cyclase
MFLAAFPDAHITNEDVIAEGDKVVRRYTTRGTHQGETEMFGPPTGRQIEQKGITIHRFEDGKIVEEWEIFDTLSMLQQLGLAPEQ